MTQKTKRSPARPYRILCLDGGGIRGFMTAVWLERLEQQLGCTPKEPLYRYFDLIAGTSTGALLACAVASGLPAAAIADLYRSKGETIFPPAPQRLFNRLGRLFRQGLSAPKYDPKPLYAELRRIFDDRTLGELHIPIIIFAYDTERRTPVVFKNRTRKGSPNNGSDVPVWQACAASSAAPAYFPAFVMDVPSAGLRPLIDGGVTANNPTACAIAEGVRRQREASGAAARDILGSMVVVSMGTGRLTHPIARDEAQNWGALEWALPIIDVLFDGATDAVDYIADNMFPDDRYFRFQTSLTEASDAMDNASRENLVALEQEALAYISRPEIALRLRQVERAIGESHANLAA